MISIIGLVVGVLIFVVCGMYFLKEKEDQEQKKIYMIGAVIGLVITVVFLLKVL